MFPYNIHIEHTFQLSSLRAAEFGDECKKFQKNCMWVCIKHCLLLTIHRCLMFDVKLMLTVSRWFSFLSFKCQSNVSYVNANCLLYCPGSTWSCLLLFRRPLIVFFLFIPFFSFFYTITFVEFIDCQKFYWSHKIFSIWVYDWFSGEYLKSTGQHTVHQIINIDMLFLYLARFQLQQTFQFYFCFYFVLFLTLIFSFFVWQTYNVSWNAVVIAALRVL